MMCTTVQTSDRPKVCTGAGFRTFFYVLVQLHHALNANDAAWSKTYVQHFFRIRTLVGNKLEPQVGRGAPFWSLPNMAILCFRCIYMMSLLSTWFFGQLAMHVQAAQRQLHALRFHALYCAEVASTKCQYIFESEWFTMMRFILLHFLIAELCQRSSPTEVHSVVIAANAQLARQLQPPHE